MSNECECEQYGSPTIAVALVRTCSTLQLDNLIIFSFTSLLRIHLKDNSLCQTWLIEPTLRSCPLDIGKIQTSKRIFQLIVLKHPEFKVQIISHRGRIRWDKLLIILRNQRIRWSLRWKHSSILINYYEYHHRKLRYLFLRYTSYQVISAGTSLHGG